MYVGAPARSIHFCTNFSCGERHTVMQYLSRFSVRGVVSMRSKEKFGSSLATVMERSLAIMVVSHLGFRSSSTSRPPPLYATTRSAVGTPLLFAAGQADEDVDEETRFLRPLGAAAEAPASPADAPIRNFEMRSFCVACLFGWLGALVWLGSFCRRACERTLRRVSSLRAMVLMDVMNWKPGLAPLVAAVGGGGEAIVLGERWGNEAKTNNKKQKQ